MQYSLSDLIELRKLRKAREGIDLQKLNQGDKKKRKRPREPEEVGGLRKGAAVDDEDELGKKEAKARRVVRTNNFTNQTNSLDVDKHMMVYIEENLKVRGKPRAESEEREKGPPDPQDELYNIANRWKVDNKQKAQEEGSVTNSLSMLTAIPEVDLGMDARLKNIEETEKAKRVVAVGRHDPKMTDDEARLVANRFYRPNLKTKSDAEIMRDAKLEAMGLAPASNRPHRTNHDRPQMATDEIVMERFKKRMRK
ncbi:hypothetical protein FISHEDRAFT_35379 [Fistulina hepatica ATCC 64428]|uniref:Hepatocellular carcinoma-associated antigen 59 n=1 Tax=Fistulina hepatica ATCC 64428 TaxID=1128425 RepID=A0A0D7ALZ9_9AGAR|nr:hypothetical protein FISHEDRAFT_35379 [Fistulina hepatica ATCC 64428]